MTAIDGHPAFEAHTARAYHVQRIRRLHLWSGQALDGDQFVTYQMDGYQKVNRRVASEHDARSVLHVKGRIGSVAAAPVGVPLILDLNGKHRVRMVTAQTERVMTFGGLLD